MKIIFNSDNYHFNKESKSEISFVNETIKQLLSTHKDLNGFIDRQFKKKQPLYCEEERDRCLYKFVKGIVSEIYSYFGEEVKNKVFYKELYDSIVNVFPYLLENESFISMKRFYLYEPHIVMMLNICNTMQRLVDSKFTFNEEEYIEKSLLLMCHNAVRAIKSSIMMFAIGDDVHGKALYRGIIELIARIYILPVQPDDFEKFNNVNMWVQEIYKHNENEQEAIEVKEAFKAKYKINESQLESFMLLFKVI